MKKQSGFTLIELMIVVAIVAILAAIALPAYQNYTRKARFSEVVAATSAVKTAIEVCFSDFGTFDDCEPGENGVPNDVTSGTYTQGYVDSLSVASGAITAIAVGTSSAASNGLMGESIIITPSVEADKKLTWVIDATSTCKTVDPKIC